MPKRKHKQVIVQIEQVDYPNRATGVVWELPPVDEVDSLLEIYRDYRSGKRGRKIVTKGGIPGQIYRAIEKRTRGEAKEVQLLELLDRSPLEKKALCPVHENCGGCTYQTLSYETELLLKRQQIERLFSDAGFSDIVISIKRSPLEKQYRNKMEYTFGDQEKGGPLTLGLHCPGHFYEIIPTPMCNIVPEDFNLLRMQIQNFFRSKGLSYYHRVTKQGFLRHCVIRASLSKKELMVNLVTTSAQSLSEQDWQEWIESLLRLPLEFSLVSIFHTTNDSPADVVLSEEVALLYGKPYLEEELSGLQFRVGPFSFFQPNALSAENLYQIAIDMAGDLTGKTVYDLYCGTGTITQLIAKKAQRAIGVEIVEEAVEKARESAALNEIANVKFLSNDVLEELERLAASEEHPDVIFIDPPREGIHPKALAKIAGAGAEKMVYISCNPRTQVRDALELQKLGYVLKAVQAVDQFPRTKHVETVVLLSRK